MQVATLAGGCFWCLEGVFSQLTGVEKIVSGYTDGHRENPNYETVCLGATGHAEAVQVFFDEKIISYEDILNIFFTLHNPTTLNQQGADIGTQYRSGIYYSDTDQKVTAEKVISEQQGIWDTKIVTELKPISKFWVAEEYHQRYYENNPMKPYCTYVIDPKISKVRQKYRKYFKEA